MITGYNCSSLYTEIMHFMRRDQFCIFCAAITGRISARGEQTNGPSKQADKEINKSEAALQRSAPDQSELPYLLSCSSATRSLLHLIGARSQSGRS